MSQMQIFTILDTELFFSVSKVIYIVLTQAEKDSIYSYDMILDLIGWYREYPKSSFTEW